MESIKILYSQNMFVIKHNDIVRFLPASIHPQLYHSIRSMQLQYSAAPEVENYDENKWREIWNFFSGMKGLRHLIVEVKVETTTYGHWINEDLIFESLNAVVSSSDFYVSNVHVHRPIDETSVDTMREWGMYDLCSRWTFTIQRVSDLSTLNCPYPSCKELK